MTPSGLDQVTCSVCHKSMYRFSMSRFGTDICKSCSRRRRSNKHGWSENKYDRIMKEQSGACAICRTDSDELVIDHDHTSGYRRGLLCSKCNTGLGQFNDNADTLQAAITYLDSSKRKDFKESLENFTKFEKQTKIVANISINQ